MATPPLSRTAANGNGFPSCPTNKKLFASRLEPEDFEPHSEEPLAPSGRRHGKWRLSPLREAGMLLGVLKREGLTGKGIVKAFEKWAPRIIGVPRAVIGKIYFDQTGREMADDILLQKADKVLRYKQLPPEAEIFRRMILKARHFDKKPIAGRQTPAERNGAAREATVTAIYKVRLKIRTESGDRQATVLIAASNRCGARKRASAKVAKFFDLPAKAVTTSGVKDYALDEFLVIDSYVVEGR